MFSRMSPASMHHSCGPTDPITGAVPKTMVYSTIYYSSILSSYYSLLHSGLDLDLAAETFAQISRVENTSVCELVSPFF